MIVLSLSLDIAVKTGLRGMDAVVIQVAEEFDAVMVSLDVEMMKKAKTIVNVKNVEEL